VKQLELSFQLWKIITAMQRSSTESLFATAITDGDEKANYLPTVVVLYALLQPFNNEKSSKANLYLYYQGGGSTAIECLEIVKLSE